MKYASLIFIAVLLNLTKLQAQVTLYIPPFASLRIDTTIWEVPLCEPSFINVWQFPDRNVNVFLRNKMSKKTISFKPGFFRSYQSRSEFEKNKKPTVLDGIFADFDKPSKFFFYVDSMSFLSVSFDLADPHFVEENLQVLGGLKQMDVHEFDSMAGYPLSPNCNEDSLKSLRLKQIARFIKADLSITPESVKKMLLRDKEIGFTFIQWQREMSRIGRLDAPECEAVFMQSEKFVLRKKAFGWMMKFNSDFHIDDREERESILKRYARLNYGARASVQHVWQNEFFFWIFPDENIISVRAYHSDNEHCVSHKVDVPMGSRKLVDASERVLRNLTFCIDMYSLEKEILVMNLLKCDTNGDRLFNQFSDRYLLCSDCSMNEPVHFVSPTFSSGDLFVEGCYDGMSEEEFSYLAERTMSGKPLDENGGRSLIMAVSPESRNLSAYNSKLRVYRTPMIVADYNKNGYAEFIDVYIRNGTIIYCTFYELTDQTVVNINPTTEMQNALYRHRVVKEFLQHSTFQDLITADEVLESQLATLNFKNIEQGKWHHLSKSFLDGDGVSIATTSASSAVITSGDYGYGVGNSRQTYSTFDDEGDIKFSENCAWEYPGGIRALTADIKQKMPNSVVAELKSEWDVKIGFEVENGKMKVTYIKGKNKSYNELVPALNKNLWDLKLFQCNSFLNGYTEIKYVVEVNLD
jgi:hypothetical protein